MATIGVAIIGSGIFVKEQHIPAVLKCNLLSLKAIFSRSLSSAEATAALIPSDVAPPALYAEDAGPERSLAALLARDDIAAVIVALPILAQPAFVRAALAAGKHVLAEKPIAKDVASARELITYASSETITATGATLSIAENQRYFPRFRFALQQAADANFGRVTHFSVRVSSLMSTEGKYYKTAWRQTPEYQGGFLLDGGVHYAAGIRMLLLLSTSLSAGAAADRDGDRPAAVSARTALVREHLPPIDTVAALVTTKSGATGTYQHSVGSTLSSYEFDVAYEGGSLRLAGDTVTVTPKGGEAAKHDIAWTIGVAEEVDAWARGIRDGKRDLAQAPEEALADLEFVEKMFRSGEEGGKWMEYELQ